MTHRLLPAGKSAEAPAFELSLPGDVHSLLSRNSLRLKLVIKDGHYSLKAGNAVLPLDLAKGSTAEVFKHLSQSTLKGIGTVSARLEVNSPVSSPASTASAASTASDKAVKKPSPPPRAATATPTSHSVASSSSPSSSTAASNSATRPPPQAKSHTLVASGTKSSHIIKRIVHLLALGPITRTDLIRRAKLTPSDVDSVIKSVSMVYSPNEKQLMEYPHMRASIDTAKEPLYVLNFSTYKDLKLGEWKYKEAELKLIKHNCQLAFNHLKYPSNHPARLRLESKVDDDKQVKSEIKKVEKKEEKKEIVTIEDSPKKKRGNTDTQSTTHKPSTSTSAPLNSKKRPREQDGAYLHDLAQRFQVTYKEYEALYKAINVKKKRDQEEVKRLFDMHRNLESWKKQLWSSVPTE